ncbi:MAG: dihydroorotate dehydrogenase 2, nonfunctional [Candidatus Woesebacteria bacterium GW2011_GWA1_33_30]|uniref:Dihydroorotate dehydrogenase (quinone) n=1 Tax=Candidatus Woesebacteria bacterium GW2011_GWA2_33_28 TaxID=1618561 RepID=A0A0G0AAK4_9BACT|nr:MAG: dihydroorotate dehydrogenase 2, nonfunctional [Candidatus Woesebacteria bacterium GW2011_GWA2_33_28]KKP49083.1 MAG: dihydroorotate dehydrogenase 2, nonfunctional [Candidatus Woesebacteria bacterium GW2011_GWA1_33_30]KKP50317.1 MAG: dihydroorotate dehydrogenase 2, nonfunctional [Microgenomates group bacterium GW2011_GWC1_33_32]KKP52674.1 MAG: dihydroorotate dehydrogenase 2, nonfunctional [Candidatus Woesebacteria bacterium GW2011_GWB1_33_38]KKP56295.1 MAG: dihydroorotate dehydrogenase 2,
MGKVYIFVFGILILLGLADSVFLTWEHYTLTSIGCPISPWINCLAVTSSKYSEILGIPLSLLGSIYYIVLFFLLLKKETMFKHFFLLTSSFGVLFSFYLIYIQVFAIGLFCLYCLASALISFLIFGLTWIFFKKEWSTLVVDSLGYGYKFILKPMLFMVDAEVVHETMVKMGESLPKLILNLFKRIFVKKYKNLEQKILDIKFLSPIGLAAGFDYEARLTQTLPFIGFGFQTVGTITNMSYGGNPKPRLGRLPQSKSLLVNKGFKNLGIEQTLKKLSEKKLIYPVGISIGRTNSPKLDTIDKSITDILSAFKYAKNFNINNAYYELNISCPNIIHDAGINFYKYNNLEKLLLEMDKIKLTKPIFVKMPIDQTDGYTLKMLNVISRHNIKGVIFGNLQTNKKNKVLVSSEVNKFKMGKYSGKPTFEDSNRLIKLTYKNFKDRFIIIGCGGVFNADDAWVKFANGASLVQLITGMIFEGPQLTAQINRDLSERLQKEGYKNISQIVGSAI